MTRGEKLMNPGNIRISPIVWAGKVVPSSDPDFEEFENVEFGLRAIAKIIGNYNRLYGLQTVAQIIGRWAPSSENDTSSYIANVSSWLGVGNDDVLDLRSPTVLAGLVSAIVKQENGSNPYDGTLILDACNEALSPSLPIS